jgi:hypothetical protein
MNAESFYDHRNKSAFRCLGPTPARRSKLNLSTIKLNFQR